ncbi:TIGR02117 family protein [Acuticoccus sp. I52.16.1]|uniref:TIGR02117 family protein n=1 Tax=Acuticoccus sp. I52.16.1 TaxID=2928472 RepID=UPI001FD5D528|nr:TIGR02117 family protein [Acuticoccus sp. I52.16.1]UOM33063.1 TIGR02117 family protein [Acuticoccus sp. I52.16.1]
MGSRIILPGADVGEGPTVRTVYLVTSPIHADIVVPVADDVADWRPLLRSAAFAGSRAERDLMADAASHVALGWGSEAFYLNVRKLADLRPGHVLDALWDDGVVHLTVLGDPAGIPGAVALRLSDTGYRRLVAGLDAALARDGGAPVPLPGRAYGPADGFFAAVPQYSVLRTCNVWVAALLRRAGLAMPLWSPFVSGLARAAKESAAQ